MRHVNTILTFTAVALSMRVFSEYAVAQSGLALTLTPYEPSVTERAPVVLRIALENRGSSPASVYFQDGAAMADRDLLSLEAIDQGGEHSALAPLRVLTANRARAAGAMLQPGSRLTTDFVTCLYVAERHRGVQIEPPHFLTPGNYTIRVSLRCPELVEAEAFELTVRPAEGDDRAAVESFEALPLYAQGACRKPSDSSSWACGGKAADVLKSFDRVHNECADSVFAFWLQYWKYYHGMETGDPAEKRRLARESIAFAEQNCTFPLADNLLLRAAISLKDVGDLGEAQKALSQLVTQFPDTDCSREKIAEVDAKLAKALQQAPS